MTNEKNNRTEDIKGLIIKYQNEMKKPLDKKYDLGYIEGIVDLLGDLISFLGYDELNSFADEMEKIQSDFISENNVIIQPIEKGDDEQW